MICPVCGDREAGPWIPWHTRHHHMICEPCADFRHQLDERITCMGCGSPWPHHRCHMAEIPTLAAS